jgi:probable phosphoglycerate mutase
MGTKLLFIRHGSSGATDIYLPGRMPGVHLSSKGIKEAMQLAKDLEHVHIDRIFSSPLERTMETAGYIASLKKMQVEISEDILEIDFGEWSGKTFDELRKMEEWTRFNYFRLNTRPPGGENILEVQARVVRSIDKILRENKGKTLAFVSHGDPIRSAICYYTGISLDLMSRVKILTSAVSVLKIHDWDCELQCLNFRGNILEEVIGK